jgi:hypothetical protein
LQKQKKPFEEIMKRRKIREIITNSPYELQFSRMNMLELDNGEFKEKNEDPFYQI